MNLLRRIRHFMAGKHSYSPDNIFTRHRAGFNTAIILVHLYYWGTLFILGNFLVNWQTISSAVPTDLLWPVAWIRFVEASIAINLIGPIALLAGILAVLFPKRRIFRVFVFLGLFQLVAFTNSFGKINHGHHSWLIVGFFFIFLPNGNWKEREHSITNRQYFLTIFWAAQTIILIFYSMSGLWKVRMILYQMIRTDQVHFFHPYGVSYGVARQIFITNQETILGPLLIDYPLLGWPFSFAVVYIELFSVFIAFRPSLHRIWGVMLVLFHFGTVLFMSIDFSYNILLIGLLFMNSPFQLSRNSWIQPLSQLPLFGALVGRLVNSTWSGDPKISNYR